MLFPLTLREVIKTYVSLNRITDFLNAEELDPASISDQTENDSNSIEINSVTMAWDDTDRHTYLEKYFIFCEERIFDSYYWNGWIWKKFNTINNFG